MKRILQLALSSGLCLASLIGARADATTLSGYFNDNGDTALYASNGYQDLEAAQFGSNDAVARNVAIYALDVTAAGTVEFKSSGYGAGGTGAQPYLSIFAGSGTKATFVDSSYFDPNIDFDVSESIGVGAYLFAIGVYENLSFAENGGIGTLADGFTALGDPGYLGDAFYQVGVTSSEASFTTAPAVLLGGSITQPPSTTVPEPAGTALVGIGMILMITARRRPIRFPSCFLRIARRADENLMFL